MARISKTVCDGCGFEEDTSEGTRESMYPTVFRVTVQYGLTTPDRARDYLCKTMELCETCRDRLENTIALAMLPENLKGD